MDGNDRKDQVLCRLVDQLEKDILYALQDIQKQVLHLKIHYFQKRILFLKQELSKMNDTLELFKSQNDSVSKQQSVEYWEHRQFITEQDIFWSERELVTWTENFSELLSA